MRRAIHSPVSKQLAGAYCTSADEFLYGLHRRLSPCVCFAHSRNDEGEGDVCIRHGHLSAHSPAGKKSSELKRANEKREK